MPLNLPTGRSQVTLFLKHSSITRYSMISYVVMDDGTAGPMSVTAAACMNAWNAAGSMKSVLDNNVTVQNIRVRQGSDSFEPLTDDFPQSSVGSAVLNATTPNNSVLVRKKTYLPGREGRGRFYFPHMLAVTDLDEAGFITAGRVTTLQSAVNTWFNAHTTASLNMYLFHPDVPLGGASPPGSISPGGPPTLIVDLSVQQLLGSQRRRLGR